MYRITFVFDLFKHPSSGDRGTSNRALEIMLRALMHIDELELRDHPEIPLLYESGVRYQMEPEGEEDWQDVLTALHHKVADCEDLACWRAAEYRVRYGIAAVPTYVCRARPGGGYLYHILVKLPDGRVEDPSRRLGMK